ncbi:MAG: hypothetical protein DRI48_07455 [Chloroflexi bacterium]|nr:MAG: hypothetical protein DRI48_07455 [Chloroflexota bacterium]
MGRNDDHLQLIVEDKAGTTQRVIWWQWVGQALPQGRFDLAYTVRASDYRGQREVQVEWIDARPVEAPSLQPGLEERPAVRIVDYRREPDPIRLLELIRRREKDVQVWSEGEARAEVAGLDRRELGPARELVIWSTPPGPGELQAVLEKVSPQVVYLVGIDPGADRPQEFLERLAGLVKHAINANRGRAQISTLAAATAQREATVRAGLAWLAAQGHLVVLNEAEEGDDQVRLAPGDQTVAPNLPQITARLRGLLEETAAYRTHFARADREALIR